LNWLKCLLRGHEYKVRYVPCQSVSEIPEGTLVKFAGSNHPGDVIPVGQIKRRAIICERCGKELKVG